jgi:hypothetical protein
MKKLHVLIFALILGSTAVSAQGQFRAGISGGLPIGDAGDFATFAIAIDLGYLFEISDTFDAGVTAGYNHSFTDNIEVGGMTFEIDDVQFAPIAASGRFDVSDAITLGADVGYALGVNDGNEGGFYYSPRAQYGVSESIDIVVAFRGVSENGGSWDLVTAGVEFGID